MDGTDRFEAFVRRYQDMVFATAVRLLGRSSEAEDVAQAVFLKAFQRFGDIGDSPSAAGWLKTVTRNACLNHLTRYRARWRLFSELSGPDDEGADQAFEASVPADTSPLVLLEREEEQENLEQALRSLPDHQRVPLVLFHLDAMSYHDISSVLGISLAKVKTDIHRGRLALRQHLSRSHAIR